MSVFDLLPPPSIEYIGRILAAAALGALVGLERDIHGRAAGLRTHLLVSAGAAIFTVLSEIVARDSINAAGEFVSDPGRIAAQVITGIGFLGAGAIIKDGFAIRGLTTAACLWIVAAIGMTCGMRQYEIAVASTVLALVSLILLKVLERLLSHDSYRVLTIVTINGFDVSKIVAAVERKRLKVNQVAFDRDFDSGRTTTRLLIRVRQRGITDRLAHDIVQSLEKTQVPVCRIQWEAKG
ncbi:MAG: MgtC/SapB family protein [Planctomycetales bacterium]|nr:MgtC/SapB family protein [Planctomycetales bacterium]